MAVNQRIFYACQAVAVTPSGTAVSSAHIVHGVQSVGMTSTFTLDQIFELGQLELYENVEEVADIEVTLEKVIDGYKLIFDLASGGTCEMDLVAAAKAKCDVYVAIFDDGLSHATGVPRNICMNSGMSVSSVSYSYSVDGNATESVTLVGNDRFWNSTTAGVIGAAPSALWTGNPSTNIDGTDTPASGVVRRTNVLVDQSTIPAEVKSQRDATNIVGSSDGQHIQSISVSADFGQDSIQELGRFGPYTRYATFPIEVSTDFEVMATYGDLVSVSGSNKNLQNRSIVIKDTAGTVINCGGRNKLTSVSYSGGDTGGGNATITYSYSTFNDLSVCGGRTHA
jgi:hypothetical protein